MSNFISGGRGRGARRQLAALAVAGCVGASAVAVPTAAQASPPANDRPSSFVKAFTSGDRSTGAMFRWWWPSAVDADVAVEQLREVKAAGYAGVEIAFVMDGTRYVVDQDQHEYGDSSWREAIKAVLTEANKLGLQVDLTLGGRWPAAVPGLDVSSVAASQEIITGDATVASGQTFQADAPAPPERTYEDRTMEGGEVMVETKVSTPTLVTATAARCLGSCEDGIPELDLNTVVDLTDNIADGKIIWTAPDEGTWVVTAYWQRGTAQRNDAPFGSTVSPLSDPESRVVNHFDEAGTSAILDFFGGLLDAETRALLEKNGGSLFEDSLELSASQLWTPAFLEAFKEVNGYSLHPYLPVVAKRPAPNPFAPKPTVYTFPEGQADIAERVAYDVEQTLNVLYRDEHVLPIKKWAHERGLTFRAQAYGEPIDLGEAAGYLDITECETLGCSEAQFRTAAAGVALDRKGLLSTEMLPWGFGHLYGLTPAQIATGEVLPDGTERRGVHREFSFGVNHLVFHGLPYPTIPPGADGALRDGAAHWPGFHAFTSNIGEAFGPRNPTWTMERDISAYYARAQRALRVGDLRLDVAVLNTSLTDGSADGAPLGAAGFTYGYVTPGALRGETVAGGRLAPDGPAFQALIIDERAVDVATANQVARMANDGLTVVVVGEGPQHTLGYAANQARAEARDELVREIFDEVIDGPNGHQAQSMADAAALIEAHGARPEAQAADDAVVTVHRRGADLDTYLMVNRSTDDVTTTVSLASRAGQVPYLLNPWTGQVTSAGVWHRIGDRINLEVDIKAGSTRFVALAGPRFGPGKKVSRLHAVATSADDAQWSNRGLEIRADDAGTYRTRLGDGRTVRTTVRGVPAERRLTNWSLRLDEWLPGNEADASNVTRHKIHKISDVPLESWTEIDGIENAVGVGTYTTRIDVSRRLARAGAVLELGDVGGSYRVYVNGKRVATPDQFGTTVELGSALRPGRNRVQVVVASTLLNRLRVHRPAEFGDRAPTVNGLVGPVILDPYKVVRD